MVLQVIAISEWFERLDLLFTSRSKLNQVIILLEFIVPLQELKLIALSVVVPSVLLWLGCRDSYHLIVHHL